jgi:fatty acid desaturase
VSSTAARCRPPGTPELQVRTVTADEAAASPRLDAIPRRRLVDEAGTAYLEFRATLTTRWGRLWLRLAAGHVAIVVIGIAVVAVAAAGGTAVDVAAAVVGAVALGYAIHYLVLFQHEAAHYNLARTRAGNERLANLAIGLLIGEDIASYRRVHLAHHRYLGTVEDTERSYFDALGRRWLAECLTGIRPVRVALARARLSSAAEAAEAEEAEAADGRRGLLSVVTLGAVVLNGTIVVGALVLGAWPLAVAWVLGLAVFWPLFNSGRQILEHRSFEAEPTVDYSLVPHGPTNRLFGSGPLASTLGGAGFNRHLLHHWDPAISCTRLRDLERYLARTEAAPALDDVRSTYLGTLRRLSSR